MKLIVLGDTHGREHWKHVVQNNHFDLVIFLGDYFDSNVISSNDQIQNFREIISFKESAPEKTILLTGNHDMHYLPVALQQDEYYTGFQRSSSFLISQLLQEHLPLMQMCFRHSDFLFSHAGVTNTWLRNNGYDFKMAVDQFINELFRYKPSAFLFNGISDDGNDITQSPVWVRPQSLMEDAYPLKHVVGHTKVKQLNAMGIDGQFFFADILAYREEFLVIEEDGISIGA